MSSEERETSLASSQIARLLGFIQKIVKFTPWTIRHEIVNKILIQCAGMSVLINLYFVATNN